MGRWRSLQQLREDFKASGIDLGKPTVHGPGTGSCRGKVRHPTAAIAVRAVVEIQRTTHEAWRKRRLLDVYRCRWCAFWHVGHRRERRYAPNGS